jgi:hypothetical protein
MPAFELDSVFVQRLAYFTFSSVAACSLTKLWKNLLFVAL